MLNVLLAATSRESQFSVNTFDKFNWIVKMPLTKRWGVPQ